jgi:pyrroline-5-carboxylate reductase
MMNILLIGCGHMGGAMLAGWLASPGLERVDVIDPHAALPVDTRVRSVDVPDGPYDMAVLAVKPQVMDAVCAAIAPTLDAATPVLSIAAGIPIATLARHFGETRGLVRAMPNTPGAIGQGITGYVTNRKISLKQSDVIDFLLGALGLFVRLEREELMDAVTALSGSGPAYVFALTESLEKAGIASGLPGDVAAKLARQTVIGAAALMSKDSAKSPETLRKAVTSPGGTTEAALNVLLQNRALDSLLESALKAAAKRSKDLAQSQ